MISCLERLTNDDVQVRPEEAGIVLFVFGIWLAAIALFFNRSSNYWVLNSFGTIVLASIMSPALMVCRWGKIRRLDPYIPSMPVLQPDEEANMEQRYTRKS